MQFAFWCFVGLFAITCIWSARLSVNLQRRIKTKWSDGSANEWRDLANPFNRNPEFVRFRADNPEFRVFSFYVFGPMLVLIILFMSFGIGAMIFFAFKSNKLGNVAIAGFATFILVSVAIIGLNKR